ncbi:TonB family protein [Bermanella marisrubri]|uniref:TonB C-terminal domain-containing protein n=1 Tax=Bermanella marisrubri TaxID=207949 RepID=Q1MZ02_9GAMM|nr:TonB family protein [Bermanella marisrubri]EAT11226.1 hypothetical protein RED65_07354 [Oceanobacter sp. RED65] [Bermanella marisrubri]QIZ85640.1 TonB family protein [Bermanella marisrubri]
MTRIIVCLLFLSISQITVALTLNGIASYQQLRKEYYIAALYLSQSNDDPQSILQNQDRKRMALRVTAKRWSPRRWSLQWQNDIAINNVFSSDPDYTQGLLRFTGFLRDNLSKGDEVIIDYLPAEGTRISINNVTVVKTSTAQLFDALLNAWIGQVPPSREFKNNILSLSDDHKQLLDRYNSLSYSGDRTAMVNSWIAAEKETAAAFQKEQQLKRARALAAKKAEEEAKQKAQQKQARASKPTKPPSKKVIRKPVKKQKIVSTTTPSKEKKSKAQIKAEQDYYLALYRWELRRAIHQAVEYPAWARQFGQKGLVTVNFTVNRQAEIKKLDAQDQGASDLLVNELKRATTEVVPFLLPPDALEGKQWDISISYRFDPNSDDQPYVAKPSLPESLQSDKKLSSSQYKKVLGSYLGTVRAIIEEGIEYPEWSKRLNQKGKVVFEITINQDGIITETKAIESSRHEALNQAVLDAINIAQPLPIIPIELGINQTSIRIEHAFK